MSDFYLSAATQTAMLTGLINLGAGLYSRTLDDFSDDFSIDFGGTLIGFRFWGPVDGDGGSWKLRCIGPLNSWLPQVTPQPIEPGNETNRVGLPVAPELVMVPGMAVGIEQPVVNSVSTYWCWFSWNSGMPRPPFETQGLTVYPYQPGNPPYQVNL